MNNKDGRTYNPLYRIWLKRLNAGQLLGEFTNFWYFENYLVVLLGPKLPGQTLVVEDEAKGLVEGNVRWEDSRVGPRPKKYETRTPHKCQAKGVVFDKANPSKPYKAQIVVDYKNKHLGYFNTEEDAARAYDIAARNIGRKTNFSEEIS